jgi:hypothetical protein
MCAGSLLCERHSFMCAFIFYVRVTLLCEHHSFMCASLFYVCRQSFMWASLFCVCRQSFMWASLFYMRRKSFMWASLFYVNITLFCGVTVLCRNSFACMHSFMLASLFNWRHSFLEALLSFVASLFFVNITHLFSSFPFYRHSSVSFTYSRTSLFLTSPAENVTVEINCWKNFALLDSHS